MKELTQLLTQLHEDEGGAGTTEYVILLILIACVVIGIVRTFGSTIKGKFESANSGVEDNVNFTV